VADSRFFTSAGPFTLEKLAEIADAEIAGGGSPGTMFADVAPLGAAQPDHVSFIDNRRYVTDFKKSLAGACLLQPDLVDDAPAGMALLVTRNPYRGYALIAQAYHPTAGTDSPGVAPTATVDRTARLAEGVEIGPGAVIGANAEIGPRTSIGANAVIDMGVTVGAQCWIGPSTTLAYCKIGDRVIVHTGARIGQDGFGFAPGGEGHAKVPQLGRVIVGDDVEIGANSAIDRGAGPDTLIGAGTKIDNLVQIGHNVRIGKGCLIVAQVGISGSCEIGDFVMIGGQTGIAGHLKIGDGARIAAQSGVTKDIPAGRTVAGFPAVEARQHWRKIAALGRLAGSGKDS
jgi:UDP-3-O-[3-hydroxymyristoyl] glucosamine N-acyltransferase